jgi:flagellar basal body-associated protein FliL
MLTMFRWIALISAIVLVVAVAGAIVSSQPPIEPAQKQSAPKDQSKYADQKDKIALWDRWFPDSISLYTLFLVVFTAVLAVGGIYQLRFLGRAEQIATKTAEAAKKSADVAKESLIATQRAFVRVANFPWLWRPDNGRPGKYFYDITPLIENAGNTPTVDMRLIYKFRAAGYAVARGL